MKTPTVLLLSLAGLSTLYAVATGTACSSVSTNGAGGTDGGIALGLPVDCESYCIEVMANCTGVYAQYPSVDACLGACPSFPVGLATDTGTNSLGCRIYYGGTPALNDPATNCPVAGLVGLPLCGDLRCEVFCELATGSLAYGPDAGAGSAAEARLCGTCTSDSDCARGTTCDTKAGICSDWASCSCAETDAGDATLDCRFGQLLLAAGAFVQAAAAEKKDAGLAATGAAAVAAARPFCEASLPNSGACP